MSSREGGFWGTSKVLELGLEGSVEVWLLLSRASLLFSCWPLSSPVFLLSQTCCSPVSSPLSFSAFPLFCLLPKSVNGSKFQPARRKEPFFVEDSTLSHKQYWHSHSNRCDLYEKEEEKNTHFEYIRRLLEKEEEEEEEEEEGRKNDGKEEADQQRSSTLGSSFSLDFLFDQILFSHLLHELRAGNDLLFEIMNTKSIVAEILSQAANKGQPYPSSHHFFTPSTSNSPPSSSPTSHSHGSDSSSYSSFKWVKGNNFPRPTFSFPQNLTLFPFPLSHKQQGIHESALTFLVFTLPMDVSSMLTTRTPSLTFFSLLFCILLSCTIKKEEEKKKKKIRSHLLFLLLRNSVILLKW